MLGGATFTSMLESDLQIIRVNIKTKHILYTQTDDHQSQNTSTIIYNHALYFPMSHVHKKCHTRFFTLSRYLVQGLSIALLPSTFDLYTVSVIRSTLIRSTCPNPLKIIWFAFSPIFHVKPTLRLIFSIVTLSVLVTQYMFRSHLNFITSNMFFPVSLTPQVSAS